MDTLKITPEQVDTIFASKAGEDTDYSFKQGFYAAQGAARIQIAALAGWNTVAGPRSSKSFDELAADAKAGWSDEALALYDAASQSFKEEMGTRAVESTGTLRERVARSIYDSDLPEYAHKSGWDREEEAWREGFRRNADAAIALIRPAGSAIVSQTFLHAAIQSLTEAGDESMATTAREYLEAAEKIQAEPLDDFSTVEEDSDRARRGATGGQRSWQYAWRSFFPELDGEGKPLVGTFGEEYEWLDFEGFGEAVKAAIVAQDEEDSKPQEDETHRLGYSIWKREHHQPGAWELVGADELGLTDGTVEYGWRSFLPNRDEDDNLIEGPGEEYEWLEAENLEEARSEVARLQAEENEISKARGLAPLSFSAWKRTPERFGDWILMARVEKEESDR